MAAKLEFVLDDDVFDGELGGHLDADPFDLGWPDAGYLKSAVKEAKRAVGESAHGFTGVKIQVDGKKLSVDVDAGVKAGAKPVATTGQVAPDATPEELSRRGAGEYPQPTK